MCKKIETFHEYSGCRLREAVEAVEPASEGEPEPSRFALFLRGFLPKNNENHEGENGADANAVEPSFHPIKETNILQCEEASRDEGLGSKPEKRRCANPEYLQGEDRRRRVEVIGYTRERGDCPVCVAVERIIQETSNPIEIRPWTRAQAQSASQHRPRRDRDHRDEGTPRNPIRHGHPRPRPVVQRRRVAPRKKRSFEQCSTM